MPLGEPLPLRVVHAEGRNGDRAAVGEGRRSADADQAAPRAGADERAEARFAEVGRERVAPRAAPPVDQHDLRSAVGHGRPLLARAVAHGPVREHRPVQQLDEPIGNLAAAVPALVDDQPVLLPLRHELADQLVLRVDAGALHVDVAHLAAGRLVDDLAPFFNPVAEPELDLARQALHDDLPRVGGRRRRADREHDRLVAEPLERRPGIRFRVDRHAVDGQDVLACRDVDTGFVERRSHRDVPRAPVDDPLDAVRAVRQLPIDAEEADGPLGRRLHVAAAVIGVRRVQLADELADQDIHVPPRHRVLEQPAVPRAQARPVHAVHVRVVEEVALEAEHVGEDLPPLGARVDRRLHVEGGHRLLEFLRRLDVEDRELALARDEHLLAVEGHLEVVGIVEHRLLFALREIEVHDRALVVARAGARLAPVKQLAFDGLEAPVVARLRRQHDGARFEAVDVDVDVGRRGRPRFLLLLLGLLRLLFLVLVRGPGGLFRGLVGRLVRRLVVGVERGVLGVVARGERRLHVLPQRDRHEPGRVRVGPGVVEAAVHRLELAIRCVVQVLAFRLEGRLRVVQVPGRGLVQPGRLRVVEKDGAVRGGRRARIGDPARVGRPLEAEAREPAVRDPLRALIDLGRAVRVEILDVDAHRLVDERQLPAVGRPLRGVPEAGTERGHLLLGAGAVRRAQRQLVLAAPVAPVGHRLPVGRPARIAFRHAGGSRDVHHGAVLRRDREDVAARLEDGALARRRHRHVLNERLDLRNPRPQRRLVGDHVHRYLGRLLRGEVEEVQPAARLEHDAVGPERRERDVEVGEVGDLPDPSRANVVRPDVVALVRAAVGQEVDRVAMPHRLRVVGRIRGDVLRREGLQVEQEQIRRPAASIALPVAEVLRHGHVDELRAVRRVRAEFTVGHREFFGQTAPGANREELAETLASALTPGREEHARAVGGPADHAVRHRVMRQAHRLAALRRDDVDVRVAVVRSAVGDLRPVRREPREHFLSGRGAEADRRASRLRHQPDVARVDERDLTLRHRGIAQHACVDLRRGDRGRRENRQENHEHTQEIGLGHRLCSSTVDLRILSTDAHRISTT